MMYLFMAMPRAPVQRKKSTLRNGEEDGSASIGRPCGTKCPHSTPRDGHSAAQSLRRNATVNRYHLPYGDNLQEHG